MIFDGFQMEGISLDNDILLQQLHLSSNCIFNLYYSFTYYIQVY